MKKISDPRGCFSCDSFMLNYAGTWKRKEKKQDINNIWKIILEPQCLVSLTVVDTPAGF